MLSVAILGGGIGGEHIGGYAQLPDRYRIAAICDTNLALAERHAQATGARAVPAIDAVLADPTIDLVDICLPPALHVPVALQALAAGKHAIVEKPMAGSLAEADRLAAAAAQVAAAGADCRVFPVFQYRYAPAFDQLSALGAAGLLGRPIVAALETHWNRDAAYYANPWRGSWERELGGAVLSHAIHAHDLLTHYFGPVAAVAAVTTTRANPIETEDCAALSLTMANGALASSSITLGAARDTTRIRFVFEHLTAESGEVPYAPGQATWTFTARDPAQQAAVDTVIASVPDAHAGFAGFFAAVADALDGRPGREVTLDDGLAAIELVTAIYHSDRTGTRVQLPVDRTLPVARSLRP